MTIYAQDGLPIVVLERFDELNVSVNCRDDEGVLALTFGSTDAFNYAEEQWGYVNKADDGQFLLIANNDGCGPDDQRQAYMSVYCVFSTIVLVLASADSWAAASQTSRTMVPRSLRLWLRKLFHGQRLPPRTT